MSRQWSNILSNVFNDTIAKFSYFLFILRIYYILFPLFLSIFVGEKQFYD